MPSLDDFYTWCIQCCNSPNVGYSQAYRNQQKVDGITYYDCSSFVNYGLNAGGWATPGYAPTHNAFTTGNMISVILGLEGWTEVSATGTYEAGDIGWKTGHCEVCYQGGNGKGIFMGAHTSNATLPNQVSIGSSKGDPTYERSFSRLFRFQGSGPEPPKPPVFKGPSIYTVAAICGNWWQESGINPGVWEGLDPPEDIYDYHVLGKGFGLGQWTNVGGDTNGRLWKMHEWVSAQPPYNTDDGVNQTYYLKEENYWTRRSDYPDFQTLSDFLESDSTDLEYLTHAFNLCWEGIHDSSWDARVGYAQQCLDYIREWQNKPGNFGGFYLGNRYLTVAERLNNAMMVYLVLTGRWEDRNDKANKKPLYLYTGRKMY